MNIIRFPSPVVLYKDDIFLVDWTCSASNGDRSLIKITFNVLEGGTVTGIDNEGIPVWSTEYGEVRMTEKKYVETFNKDTLEQIWEGGCM